MTGEKVAYQGRKKHNTSNLLFMSDRNGLMLSCSFPEKGNHNDAYNLEKVAAQIFSDLEIMNISLDGVFLNADAGFDVSEFKTLCFQKGIIYNIDYNKRNGSMRGDDEYVFDQELYKERYVIERSNAWIDNFKALLVRFERLAQNWYELHFLAFICLFWKKKFNLKLSF